MTPKPTPNDSENYSRHMEILSDFNAYHKSKRELSHRLSNLGPRLTRPELQQIANEAKALDEEQTQKAMERMQEMMMNENVSDSERERLRNCWRITPSHIVTRS